MEHSWEDGHVTPYGEPDTILRLTVDTDKNIKTQM